MHRKSEAASPLPGGGDGIGAVGESQEAASRLPPFRRIFFLTLIFMYLPFAYTYGARLLSSQFTDLPSFYYAAQTAFRHHQSPYAPGALIWGANTLHQTVWPYLYPPPTLLLFSPFAALPYKTVKLLVLVTNHLCLLGLLFLLLHLLGLTGFLRRGAIPGQERTGEGARKELTALFLTVYLFVFHPSVVTLTTGQVNFYVIVLLCLMWYALKKKASPVLSAIPFALAIVLKTYPALFLPILLLQGKWRMAGWTLLFLALLTAGSYAVLPCALWHDWLVYVLPYGGYTKTPMGLFAPSAVWNQSVNGFASRLLMDPHTAVLLSPAAARITAYSLCAALYAAEIFLAWRLWQAGKNAQKGTQTDRVLDLEFGLFLLTMYLIAPLSWEHHLVFVLPAIFLALARVFSFKESSGTTLWVAASAFLIAWPVLLGENSWERHFFHLLLSLKFYGVLALWLLFARWLAHILRERGKSSLERKQKLPCSI